jgi:hypothetical protein
MLQHGQGCGHSTIVINNHCQVGIDRQRSIYKSQRLTISVGPRRIAIHHKEDFFSHADQRLLRNPEQR